MKSNENGNASVGKQHSVCAAWRLCLVLTEHTDDPWWERYTMTFENKGIRWERKEAKRSHLWGQRSGPRSSQSAESLRWRLRCNTEKVSAELFSSCSYLLIWAEVCCSEEVKPSQIQSLRSDLKGLPVSVWCTTLHTHYTLIWNLTENELRSDGMKGYRRGYLRRHQRDFQSALSTETSRNYHSQNI